MKRPTLLSEREGQRRVTDTLGLDGQSEQQVTGPEVVAQLAIRRQRLAVVDGPFVEPPADVDGSAERPKRPCPECEWHVADGEERPEPALALARALRDPELLEGDRHPEPELGITAGQRSFQHRAKVGEVGLDELDALVALRLDVHPRRLCEREEIARRGDR